MGWGGGVWFQPLQTALETLSCINYLHQLNEKCSPIWICMEIYFPNLHNVEQKSPLSIVWAFGPFYQAKMFIYLVP